MVKRGAIGERFDAIYHSASNNLEIISRTIYPILKLSEVVNLQRGRFSHRPRNEPKFFDGNIPFIQTGDIVRASNEGGSIQFSQTLNELGLTVSKLFQPDILVITIAANIGDTAILDYPACFPDSLVAITPKNDTINIYYLNIYFKYLKNYLDNLAPQSAQKNLNLQQLSPTPVVIPPIDVQSIIVKVYNQAYEIKRQKEIEAKALLDSIDDFLLESLGICLPIKVESESFFYTHFKDLQGNRFDPFYHKIEFEINHKSVLEGLFEVKFLSQIIMKLIKGRLPKDLEKEGECKVVQINSIQKDGSINLIDLLTSKPIFGNDQRLQKNDNLIVITGATIGKIGFWQYEGDYFLGGDVVKFQCVENINPYFIYSYLRSQIVQTELKRNVTGATNGHLSPSDIEKIQIPVPPLLVQNEIAEHIQKLRAKAKALEDEAKEILEKAKIEIEKMILGE